jgi:hypothetical protein
MLVIYCGKVCLRGEYLLRHLLYDAPWLRSSWEFYAMLGVLVLSLVSIALLFSRSVVRYFHPRFSDPTTNDFENS